MHHTREARADKVWVFTRVFYCFSPYHTNLIKYGLSLTSVQEAGMQDIMLKVIIIKNISV